MKITVWAVVFLFVAYLIGSRYPGVGNKIWSATGI